MSRDSRLDRWSEHAVRVGLFSALLGAVTLFVCALVTWPVATGVVLSYVAAFALGLLVRDQRRKLLAFSHHFLGEEVEAVHIADNDADVARERALRISGDTPAVDDDLDVPRFMADSGYRRPFPAVHRDPHPFDTQDTDPLAFAASVGREHAAVRPPAMTGARDTDAADRELTDIYGIDDTALKRWGDAVHTHPCEWFIGDADAECGEPADGFVENTDGEPVWLCPVHLAWVPEPAGSADQSSGRID